MSSPQGDPDFFVSYTAADQAWAEWIAWTLEGAGWSVVIQAWDFGAGSHFIAEMHRAAQGAERTLAVVSEAYLSSAFAAEEWQAAWAADPTGKQRKLLVVRVEDCERPGLLSQVVSIDLFDTDENTARERVLRAASGAASTKRAKPSTPPRFPPGQGGTAKKPFPGVSGDYQHSASTTPSIELIIRTTTSEVGGPISISYEVGDKERLEATVDYRDAVRIVPAISIELPRMRYRFGSESIAPLDHLARQFSDIFLPSEVLTLAQYHQIQRMRIIIDESSLQLPWELAHDGNGFMALHTSILNTIDAKPTVAFRPRASSALIVEGVPDVYGGRPGHFLPDSDRTVRHGNNAITRAVVRDRAGLIRALSDTPHDVLFLDFHSSVGESGEPMALVGQESVDLRELMKSTGAIPDIMILSACESASNPAPTYGASSAFQIATDLPYGYVIGVIGWLDMDTARQFQESFYKFYYNTKNVEQAVTQSRRELYREGCEGWWRYSLFGSP